jgi:uncharacterized caspase-like protein
MRLRFSRPVALAALVFFAAFVSLAGAEAGERRVALVIGNAAYPDQPLANPVNDARAMAQTLQSIGFDVTLRENLGKKAMETAIVEFGEKLRASDAGLFYYAGHGIQVRNRNLLVPVDARLTTEASARIEAVEVDLVTEQMAEARNRVNAIILDACRNNPFEQRLRGAGKGLAAVDAARGTLIAYATAPGSVAADGDGANGVYTGALVEALKLPGLKIEDVFKRVRADVVARTQGMQTPWESSSLTGDFVLNPAVATAATKTAAAAPPAAVVTDKETVFWNSIKDSDDSAQFVAYLERYPNGTFAELARLKRDRLVTAALPAPPRTAPATDRQVQPAMATPLPPAPPGGSWRTPAPDELRRAVAGHTLVALTIMAPRDRRGRVWIYFRPDGTASFRNEAGTLDQGNWAVDQAGALCTTWRKLRQGQRSCFRVWLAGDTLHWQGGERLNRTTGRLVRGEIAN